jgi:predicted bacteriocin transport accessory protein
MTKKQKFELGIIVFVILILISFIVIYIGSSILKYKKIKEDSVVITEKFTEIYNSSGKQIILFASPYCPYCVKFKPTLDTLANKYNFEYYYFDTSRITTNDKESVAKLLGKSITSIPDLVILEDGKIVNSRAGNYSYDDTKKFLEESEIIEVK